MITIGSSSSRPDENAAPDGDGVAEKPPKRIPLTAIPVILSVGLLVAAGYVGNRIWAARPHATAVAGTIAANAQTVPAETVKAPATAAVASKPGSIPTVVPKPAAAQSKESPVDGQLVKPLPTPLESIGSEQAVENNLDLIAPQPGQRYLQIAAINARYRQKFLSDVSRYNVQASVAPGPNESLVRIVIGPFSDRETLAAAKAQIQLQWPDCFVRIY